jgi:hypothetical protein
MADEAPAMRTPAIAAVAPSMAAEAPAMAWLKRPRWPG